MYGATTTNKDFLPQLPHTFTYNGWDVSKSRTCVCDPEWGDVDCSKRMCNYGTDIMAHRNDLVQAQTYNIQQILFTLNSAQQAQNTNTFALTFKSKLNETFTTIPIVLNVVSGASGTSVGNADAFYVEMSRDIKAALEGLPNNVIDQVQVSVSSVLAALTIRVTFTGNNVQGVQHLLNMRNYKCGDGCTPKLSGLELVPGDDDIESIVTVVMTENIVADYNSYECGRRGKCDYATGLCTCFSGYTGIACNTITALV